jgi:hypothetical protein
MTTLREVKEFLEIVQETDSSFQFVTAFSNPHSWRCIYNEVAFQTESLLTSDEMLKCVKRALTETFCGWKGGEYGYCLDNHCHLEAGGIGCCTETAMEDFTERFEAMKAEWKAHRITTNEDTPKKTKKPRITKAEKQAAAEKYHKEQQEKEAAEFRSTYQHNLLSLIADNLTMGWRVLVDDGEFKFDSTSTEKTFPVVLPDEITYREIRDFVGAMEYVRYSIDEAIEQLREQEITFAKKQAVLSKLTKEERELLGFDKICL